MVLLNINMDGGEGNIAQVIQLMMMIKQMEELKQQEENDALFFGRRADNNNHLPPSRQADMLASAEF